jgi:DNA processing protein
MPNDDIKAICLALKEQGQVGPKLFQQLLMVYGHPEHIFDNSADDIASMVNINVDRAEKIVGSQDWLDEARALITHMESLNISVVGYLEDDYPEHLRHIPDPPLAIYMKGDKELLNHGGVAIVGTTAADQEGIRAAVDFARGFTDKGKTIISGLALGIDSAGHLGALKNNGKTIAVLGCGHLNIYPEENESLAGLIADTGAVISEFDIHAKAIAGRLVSRNRLIAGLAEAVLIVQVGHKRRGELYAGQAAIDQGKPVFIYDPHDKYADEELLNNLVIKIKSLEQIDEILRYIL